MWEIIIALIISRAAHARASIIINALYERSVLIMSAGKLVFDITFFSVSLVLVAPIIINKYT